MRSVPTASSPWATRRRRYAALDEAETFKLTPMAIGGGTQQKALTAATLIPALPVAPLDDQPVCFAFTFPSTKLALFDGALSLPW